MKNLNKNWIDWFVGFCDAECNFQVYPKKRVLKSGEISKVNVGYGFNVSLHSRDLELIKLLQKNLNGVGTIQNISTKPEVRLSVNDYSGLLFICSIFDKYGLRTSNQLTRYLFFREGLNNNIKEFKTLELYQEYKIKCMLALDNQVKSVKSNQILTLREGLEEDGIDNWIVGFINGEGCFYTRPSTNKQGLASYEGSQGKCNFIIEHTDRGALELIKNRLLFGPKVSERSVRSNGTGGVRKVTYQLAISSKKDISCLIDFLDSSNVIKLQGYKYNQYTEWKKNYK